MKPPRDKEPTIFDDLRPKKELDPFAKMTGTYLQELKRRSEESRAYQSHQLTGLEIANILGDWEHKSLYMKLAKKHGEDRMMRLAKDVADKKDVANRGAYFMKVLKNQKGLDNKDKW